MVLNTNNAYDLLEPNAQKMARGHEFVAESCSHLSIAISLKRIADVLERIENASKGTANHADSA